MINYLPNSTDTEKNSIFSPMLRDSHQKCYSSISFCLKMGWTIHMIGQREKQSGHNTIYNLKGQRSNVWPVWHHRGSFFRTTHFSTLFLKSGTSKCGKRHKKKKNALMPFLAPLFIRKNAPVPGKLSAQKQQRKSRWWLPLFTSLQDKFFWRLMDTSMSHCNHTHLKFLMT